MSRVEILQSADQAAPVVGEYARQVDQDGTFPTLSIGALREAGLLGVGQPTDVGGLGGSLGDCALTVHRVAQQCASTAMVLTMHLSGALVIQAHGSEAQKRAVATGRALSTLAFSETGTRSHFWAPLSSATRDADAIRLDAQKSWCTSADHADLYVWSSRPVSADGLSTLWVVPRQTEGLRTKGSFTGLGLRGNNSLPIVAEAARIPEGNRLGADGAGFDIMMGTVLPAFNLMIAAGSIGIARACLGATIAHVSGPKHYAHTHTALRDLPTIRNYVARMQCATDSAHALLIDAIDAIENGRPDAMLRVLQIKAFGAETALDVTALGMRVCGGAAFRKDVGVERNFRDAQAASAMGPTTDVLYDFIGKAVTGMDLF